MKKTIIRIADYELYRILLPWKCLFSRQSRFIDRELEKLHPRFSGSCCYDTKYIVKRQNLLAEVVVMEKTSLAEYRQRGGTLYLEGERKRSVFSSRTKLLHIASLALIFLAGILSFRIACSILLQRGNTNLFSHSDKNALISSASAALNDENSSDISGMNMSDDGDAEHEEILSSVFASVSGYGGKISSFLYESGTPFSMNRNSPMCAFSVYGCNCEDIAYAQNCAVSFKDNEPYFKIQIPFTKSRWQKAHVVAGNIFPAYKLREELLKIGAVFESERNGSDEFRMNLKVARDRLYSCLKLCGMEADDAFWSVKRLSVSEQNGVCDVALTLVQIKDENFNPLLLVAKYAYLFGKEVPLRKTGAGLFPAKKIPVTSRQSVNKIGEIKKNGNVFVCFRTPDGRMNFEKKELVNEN